VKREWRSALTAALLVAGAAVAEAQIIDPRGARGAGRPKAWTSLFAGWTNHNTLCEPESGACWEFGDALQWRGTLEFPVGNGVTLGAVGTMSRLPLRYHGGPLDSCSACDADANVTQLLGQLRIGGGSGIHQVIDITAGKTLFSNFRTTDGTQLNQGRSESNWTLGIGIGIGLPLSPRAQVILSQEYGIIIGERVPGQSSNTAQHRTLRLGGRVGLGG
jgi:hypothetical protein